MTDPQIVCPNCRTEIRLTEQLAAPLIAETRRKFDQQLAAREADFGRRESALRKAQEELAQAKATVDEQVTARLKSERAQIAQAEAARARQAVADEIGNRDRQLAELHEAIVSKDAKLAEAQKAQAEMLRKQRELDEARREFELTVEKKVQEGLTAVRDKARLEAEDALKAKVAEKETQIAGMRPGQPVIIHVDAYDRDFRGRVEGIGAATGSRFSLLPAENASGNFVKVVQRVPVRIVLEKGQDPEHLLRPGLSVVPEVATR